MLSVYNFHGADKEVSERVVSYKDSEFGSKGKCGIQKLSYEEGAVQVYWDEKEKEFVRFSIRTFEIGK